MRSFNIPSITCAGSLLIAASAQANSPTYLYGRSVPFTGSVAAVAATTASDENPRSQFVLTAVPNSMGGLEVTGWQDVSTEYKSSLRWDLGGGQVVSVAAAGIDSSHVVTADVDSDGVLAVDTWTLGAPASVALTNSYESPAGTGAGVAPVPNLAMVSLGATQVVTAYADRNQNLVVEEWRVGTGSTPAAPIGTTGNAGQVNEVSIAQIDSSTVITAVSTPSNSLEITTWGIDSAGVHMQNKYVMKDAVSIAFAGVSIAAGTNATYSYIGGIPMMTETRSAVTTTLTLEDDLEVINWKISASGTITQQHKIVGSPQGYGSDFATGVCMLPGNVPMSSYADSDSDIWVGLVENDDLTDYLAIAGHTSGVTSIGMATAGSNFNPFVLGSYDAYFITGVVTFKDGDPSAGNLELRKWSYPVTPSIL